MFVSVFKCLFQWQLQILLPEERDDEESAWIDDDDALVSLFAVFVLSEIILKLAYGDYTLIGENLREWYIKSPVGVVEGGAAPDRMDIAL